MMQAASEDARAPLSQQAAPLASSAYSAAVAKGARRRVVVCGILLADVVLTPLVLLSPFWVDAANGDWWSSQLAHWSLNSSVADWAFAALLRDGFVAVLIVWGSQTRKEETAARLSRRAAGAACLFGVFRFGMLDWQGVIPDSSLVPAAAFLPSTILACITSPLVALAAHMLLKNAEATEALRVAEEAENGGGAANGEANADGQYTSKLSNLQTLLVLKPYFWPSTGDRGEVFMNRIRALSTWICVAASKVFNIIAPIYLGRATNGVSAALRREAGPQDLPGDVVNNLVIYALLIFLSKAFKEAQSLVYIKVQQAAYIEIADNTFKHLHNLSLDWHLKKKMGNVVRSMDRGIQAAQQTMQYVFLYLFPTLAEAAAVVLIFIFHFQNYHLAMFLFVNLFLYVYASVKVTLWRKKFRTAATQHDNNLHDRLTDSLVNYETVKYFTAEEYEAKEYRSLVRKFQQTSMTTQASLSFLNVLQQVIVNFALAGGMMIATARLLQAHGDLGEFVAVNAYIINVFTPFNFLGTIYNMVVNAIVDMRNFGQMLAEISEVQDAPDATTLDVSPKLGTPMVEFRGVSFAYSKQPLGRSLTNVSFQASRGGTLALVGQTGAGKTTMTRLLFRFYDPTAGQVLVNGQDAKSVTQKSLRAAIGMVPQDVVMFNSTIAHNISYGRIGTSEQAPTQAEIESASERAQLSQFIKQQPDGFNTMVGERGLKLSGGEKQRLAIARCLLKDPPIVVLDEATSALDSQTEERVQQALDVLSSQRTVIAIAHRLSTIRGYDEILVLGDGRVLERGGHEELLARHDSQYAAMWQRQAAGIAEETPAEASAGSAGLGIGGLEEAAKAAAKAAAKPVGQGQNGR